MVFCPKRTLKKIRSRRKTSKFKIYIVGVNRDSCSHLAVYKRNTTLRTASLLR